MKRSDFPRLAALLALAVLFTGCAGGFNAQLARGYTATAAVRDTAGVLLDAQAIDDREAAQVQEQADNARAALDIAAEVNKSDPERAKGKLAATLVAIGELRKYLDRYFSEALTDGEN